MNGPPFEITIITPTRSFKRQVQYVRLRDETGYFGIMARHADMFTALVPSMGYYIDKDGAEVYLAVSGGALSVRGSEVVLAAREVYESTDAEKLSRTIEDTLLAREKVETSFQRLLHGLEESFIEKSLRMEKEKGL